MQYISLGNQDYESFKFIGDLVISAAEHARVGEVPETNQILSSRHQHPQQHTPGITHQSRFTRKSNKLQYTMTAKLNLRVHKLHL